VLLARRKAAARFSRPYPERDGIAAGLMLLELLATEKISINKMLARLENNFGQHRTTDDTAFPAGETRRAHGISRKNPPAKLLRSPLAAMRRSTA